MLQHQLRTGQVPRTTVQLTCIAACLMSGCYAYLADANLPASPVLRRYLTKSVLDGCAPLAQRRTEDTFLLLRNIVEARQEPRSGYEAAELGVHRMCQHGFSGLLSFLLMKMRRCVQCERPYPYFARSQLHQHGSPNEKVCPHRWKELDAR